MAANAPITRPPDANAPSGELLPASGAVLRGHSGRARVPWSAVAFGTAFAVLGALVVTGVTASADARGVALLRPHDAWGAPQVRYSPWMTRLEPQRMYPLLAATSLVLAVWRRSWRPVLFAGALAGLSVALTVAVKVGLQRPDPHGYIAPSGGSYPSGHVVAVVVALAGCVLLVRPTARWWLWTPVVLAVCLVSGSMLISAAHWPTDVLGGVFLGLAVVSAASTWSVRQPPRTQQAPGRHRRGAAAAVGPGARRRRVVSDV